MRFLRILGILGIFYLDAIAWESQKKNQKNPESPCIACIFEAKKLQGGFVLKQKNDVIFHNQEWIVKRFAPASTFKIFHTLIGLDLGLINPDGLFFHYEGQKLAMKQWEKDMTIKEAIASSNVPAFQALARNIGYARMKDAIKKLEFGNQDIGESWRIDSFWLDGKLRISPLEMVILLEKLVLRDLPFSRENQESVIEFLEKEWKDGKIATKTGLSETSEGRYGWIVGWVDHHQKIYSFALHLDLPKGMDYGMRDLVLQEILENCLEGE